MIASNLNGIPLADVRLLTSDFWDEVEWVNIVEQVSFSIFPGETVGLAGESGCGKTTTASALMAYMRWGTRIRSGEVIFHDKDILKLTEKQLCGLRGNEIAMVPQNPSMALTPTMQVGSQLREVLTIHHKYQDRIDKRIIELLEDVRLPNPKEIEERYPHQLSGGQLQRIAIAMALSCNPELLLLDEPTTDLDVTTQAQILNLLVQLRREHGMAMLYVTHNLGVLAQITDRAAIMYAGKLVEIASTEEIFTNPCHPYTRGLIASVPRIDVPTRSEQKLRGFLRRSELPPGCRFAPRCDESQSICFEEPVDLMEVLPGHFVACRCCSITKPVSL